MKISMLASWNSHSALAASGTSSAGGERAGEHGDRAVAYRARTRRERRQRIARVDEPLHDRGEHLVLIADRVELAVEQRRGARAACRW
jgi:hypothetical protein